MNTPPYDFLREAGRILNAAQARSIILTGSVYDLFFLPEETLEDGQERGAYVPLVDFLCARWRVPNHIILICENNGPIRFLDPRDRDTICDAWLTWRTGMDSGALAIERMLASRKVAAMASEYSRDFDTNLRAATGNPTVALEFLRQLCLCSRSELNGKPVLRENLLILIEAADLILPEGEVPNLSEVDRHRVSICHDWFSDPGFVNGADSAVLIAESRSLLNQRIVRLPQVLEVAIPAPDEAARAHFIHWFSAQQHGPAAQNPYGDPAILARSTAGLSIQALRQLLKGAAHVGRPLEQAEVINKVEDFIQSQLGEDIVEFKKPTHTLENVVGFSRLKTFLREELIPRLQADPEDAIPGAAVCGPIGGGKTFIFEAVAAELNMVVLVLKNIRSQWYGQTDVIFERLRRVLVALSKVLIFVDEADTQFGGVGPDAHETERRLTGKIQAMMSDTSLRGRVFWLLMTARIHRLSPDIRRPGRVGDLIIPILDPEGADRREFLHWILKGALDGAPDEDALHRVENAMSDFSAATFAALRSELRAQRKRRGAALSLEQVLEIAGDHVPPAINATRRYQTLQALVNCTRRSLLPDPNVSTEERERWAEEIRKLEAQGVS